MRHTRQAVLERTRREFGALDRVVRRLRPSDWRRRVPRPPGRDPWTVKDALAHIVYWKAHSARVMRGERRPPELRGLGVDQLNRLVYARWRDRPPGDVVRWHRRVHDEVLRTLARTPAAWFGQRERSPAWPADLDGHSAAHRRRDMEAALAEAAPSARPSAGARGRGHGGGVRRRRPGPRGARPSRAARRRRLTGPAAPGARPNGGSRRSRAGPAPWAWRGRRGGRCPSGAERG